MNIIHAKSALREHKFKHLGVKPFMCDVCGMSFYFKPKLPRHGLMHSKEKPLKCKFCDKTFAQNVHLIIHTGTQTGEKTFSLQCLRCSICYKNDLSQP